METWHEPLFNILLHMFCQKFNIDLLLIGSYQQEENKIYVQLCLAKKIKIL